MSDPANLYFISLGLSNSDEHMTISWLGNRENPHTLYSLLHSAAEELSEKNGVDAVVSGTDLFGPNKDMPVWLIKILDSDQDDILKNLWAKTNVEQPHTKGLLSPNYHITQKKTSPSRSVDDMVHFDMLSLKKVGASCPNWWCGLNLSSENVRSEFFH